jgi:Zn-dependent protease/predicted transcriptional regulator
VADNLAAQPGAPTQPSLKWSWKLAEVAEIGIYVHWTFLLLIGWIVFSYYEASRSAAVTIEGVAFVLAIFACVVLHELGHALTARRFGIRTRDITLLPIGGVASLERMPEDPRQELAIAVAGPAVNVAIAVVLFILINVGGGIDAFSRVMGFGGHFAQKLLWVNVVLVLFNILPAFPMDGGRVLRALLATRMNYARATRIAAGVGQGMAVLFGVLGFFYNWFLLFIALFVYLGAEAEAQAVALRSAFHNVPVREAMMTRFRALAPEDSLETAVHELLAGAQQDFPVVLDGRVVGVLPRARLIQTLADGRRDHVVADVMDRSFETANDSDPLERTFVAMRERGHNTVPVIRDGEMVGVLTIENIGEYAMVQSALRHVHPPSGLDHLAAEARV